MISKEREAEILRLFHAEKWRIGTIAAQLGIHHSAVQRVLGHAGLDPRLVSAFGGAPVHWHNCRGLTASLHCSGFSRICFASSSLDFLEPLARFGICPTAGTSRTWGPTD